MTNIDDIPQTQVDPLARVLEWDCGTAYEMLLSLRTIFLPKEHGVPAPWAAGVRKRLSAQSQRDMKAFFGQPTGFFAYAPLHLVLEMEPPKDARHFLDYVETIPDVDFSRRMLLPTWNEDELQQITNKALEGDEISDADIEEYRKSLVRTRLRSAPSLAELRRLFTDLAASAATKSRWLHVMREYYSAFFAEEEKREKPVLQRTLADAQALASTTTVPDLIERLSNGFTISKDIDITRLVLVPSIWVHPFVISFSPADRELFVAWGTRPRGYKLVPGESVPDEALLVLRALGDPTRLRLLRLITTEPRSLQSLAHEVKLSLPTVSHHIRELRVAGLIRLEVAGRGRDSKYTVRWPSAEKAFRQVESFVGVRDMRET
ncbi:MAG: winged helix-turn-helix transcriptional regulator [Chloroflexi bacterium]|nr:winged helix-turn-helix transcriptional regulator [Chloroflexota bacterium]